MRNDCESLLYFSNPSKHFKSKRRLYFVWLRISPTEVRNSEAPQWQRVALGVGVASTQVSVYMCHLHCDRKTTDYFILPFTHPQTIIHSNTYCFYYKSLLFTLIGAAQWVGRRSLDQKVTGSIPSQGTCLGCRPDPWLGTYERLQIDVSLSH